jgi:hypothetical protein
MGRTPVSARCPTFFIAKSHGCAARLSCKTFVAIRPPLSPLLFFFPGGLCSTLSTLSLTTYLIGHTIPSESKNLYLFVCFTYVKH